MTKHIWVLWAALFFAMQACSERKSANENTGSGLLPAKEFKAAIDANASAPIVDVRTPEEYAKGHLPNSYNIDWNNTGFENKIMGFERDKPIFVYCLSGGRSAAAVEKMHSFGFKQVIELDGGIMKWRAAGFPQTTEVMAKPAGMNRQQFEEAISSDKLVLIDFYADWCAPCKKMAPYLEEINTEMRDKVTVVRINTDDNQELASQLSIAGLPTLLLFKDKKLVWKNEGYIEKAEVVKHLN
ncbi:MAG: thioredoxin [Spirosomataceae bacterium]